MLPDWISNIKLTGDFRLRYQSQDRDITAGSDYPHDRGRIRARLNFEDQINDKIKFVFGVGTNGTGGNNGNGQPMYNFSRSNNYSFGGLGANTTGQPTGAFAKDFLVLNKAYAEYKPNADWTIIAGKMDNPIWEPSSISGEKFLWDPNITPEGGAIKFQHKINDYITPYTNDAVYTIYDEGHSYEDIWEYINQVGVKGNLSDKVYYNLAGSWQDISNPLNAVPISFQRSNDLTNTTLVNDCAHGQGTSGYSLGTECYEYSYNALVGAVDLGMNDPFGDMNLPIYIPQIGVRGEVIHNPESRIPSDQKNGWEMGGYVGNSALNGWGTWQASADYRVLEQNAEMDIFPDFDQYTGDTDIKGVRTELDIGLAKNVWMDFNFFRFQMYKEFYNPALGYAANGTGTSTVSAGNPNITNYKNPEYLFQIDLNMKF